MAQTLKAPSAFRQDLLRGIRWGAILLIAMLLSIAAYRVLSSSPAVASQPKPAEELTPAPVAVEPAPAATGAIQVGEAVLKATDVPDPPQTPAKTKTRQIPLKATAPTLEPPARLSSPRFEPVPVAPMKPIANAFVAAPLPDPAPATAPTVDSPAPTAVPAAPPPSAESAADNSKQGNRAVRAVRSVGRIFRFGRKDETKDGTPAKK